MASSRWLASSARFCQTIVPTPCPARARHRSGYNGTVYFVYMVRCADGTLYTGYARDPEKRILAHNAGRGAKYTSQRRPVSLVYSEASESLSATLKREYAVKCLTRREKESLIREAARGDGFPNAAAASGTRDRTLPRR
jgi:putative endonuclease